ncbi:MAG: hypothetical protein ACOZCL_06735 [Bacillota bacterium]
MVEVSTYNRDLIKIEIGKDIIPMADDMIKIIKQLRKELEDKYKKEFPLMRLADNMKLEPSQLRILYKGEQKYEIDLANKENLGLFVKELKNIIESNI